jgi:hypothetical protein
MKNLIIIFFAVTSLNAFSQENFKWDKVIEVNKTQTDLYSSTKEFIADYWKSANNVIQNDDREGGVLIVKGITKHPIEFNKINVQYYTYAYTIKFYLKENRCRILIENVFCESGEHKDLKLIQPNDTEYPKYYKPEKCKATQQSLKYTLNNIVLAFEEHVKKENNSNW